MNYPSAGLNRKWRVREKESEKRGSVLCLKHFTHVSMVVGGVVWLTLAATLLSVCPQGGCDATPSKLKIVGQNSRRSTVDLHGLQQGMMGEYWGNEPRAAVTHSRLHRGALIHIHRAAGKAQTARLNKHHVICGIITLIYAQCRES